VSYKVRTVCNSSCTQSNIWTGGEISVYSAGPGQGSTFAFYVTAYTAESPEDRRDSLTRVLSNMQVEDPAEQPEYSVLIVEVMYPLWN